MDYFWTLEIPKTASEDEPYFKDSLLPPGWITEVRVIFIPGPAGTAKCRIKHNERVIYPTNPDEWYSGDDIMIKFADNYPLPDAQNKIILEGYNDSTKYLHRVFVGLTVQPLSDMLYPTFFS